MHDKFADIIDTYTKGQPRVVPFQKPTVSVEKMKLPKLNKIN